MFFKKLFALFLVSTLTVSVFSGCMPKEDKTQKSSDKTAGTRMVGNMYKKGLPIVKNKTTFRMYSIKDARMLDFNDMKFMKDLEEKTNIHIDWEFEDYYAGGQKKQLILASGQYPDAFFMGITMDDIAKYKNDGVFIKLDPLIEQYGENINAAFAQKLIAKKLCTYLDGNIYTLGPGGEDEGQYNPDQLFIYKPWLDKLGLAVPTTMDEFYLTLTAFKEKDPNGNGKADEIPFSFRNASSPQGLHSFFATFGRADFVNNVRSPAVTDHFVVENGKVVFTADKQEYKDAIVYMNKMFKEGLFDKEGFTQDIRQYFAKGKTEPVTLGSFVLWNAPNMTGPERAREYVPVAPLKGPDGKRRWTKYNTTNGAFTGATFAITKACKHPEIVLRWVDQFFDKKIAAQAIFGAVGTVMKEGADGILDFNPIPEGMSFDEFRYQQALVWPPSSLYNEDYGKVLVMPEHMTSKNEIKNKLYDPYLVSETLPTLQFDEDETQWNITVGNAIQNYVNQKRTQWLLDGSIGQEWEAYIVKLKQMKTEEHVKRIQTAYDRALK